jgi:hypothetical protein
MRSYAPDFAGMRASYSDTELGQIWDATAGSDLPKWHTPEMEKLAQTMQEDSPWLGKVQFDKSMSRVEQLKAKAALVQRVARGDKITPDTVNKAIAKGKEDANRNNRRVSAGKALGAGRHADLSEAKTTSLFDAYTSRSGNL